MAGQKLRDLLGITAWRQRRQRRRVDQIRAVLIQEMFDLTNASHQPNKSPLNTQAHSSLEVMRANFKVLGADLAARHYGAVASTRKPVLHDAFVPRWQPTRFNDYLQAWFLQTCDALQVAPILHRKLWEEVYVVNTLKQAGMLGPGKRGIVFGVGEERLPAYFASLGAQVLATDLAPDDPNAKGWIETAQHGSLERLYYPQYLGREDFGRQVSFRHADMNDISGEWDGQFDFAWSVCAFEHLGSIEQGLRFVERTGRLLKPGGVAVHTSEFNYSSNDRTVDNWITVLFRRRDYETLADRLVKAGYELPPIDFDVGSSPVDAFVDLPPYASADGESVHDGHDALHLKLLLDGFPSTCYGVTFSKPMK